MRVLGVIMAGLILAGCAIVQAKREYVNSTESYKACLLENVATPQNCEGLRLAMEADERKYYNTKPPGSDQITVMKR